MIKIWCQELTKNYYDNSQMIKRNDGDESGLIKITIKVKQGGLSYSRLFAM